MSFLNSVMRVLIETVFLLLKKIGFKRFIKDYLRFIDIQIL